MIAKVCLAMTICTMGLTIPLASTAWSVDPDCNSKKTQNGNCLTEDKCDAAARQASESACTGTEGKYYEDAFKYDCIDGESGDYCNNAVPAATGKCTCQYNCVWSPTESTCTKGEAFTSGGTPSCATKPQKGSAACRSGG